jgi:hypothetical protein
MLIFGLINAQSKKKQIELLNNQLDSIKNTLKSEQISVKERNSLIHELETKIRYNIIEINNLIDRISSNSKELLISTTQIEGLQKKNKEKSDSLVVLRIKLSSGTSEIAIDTTLINRSNFFKPIKKEDKDIEDWLKQFSLTSFNVCTFKNDDIDWIYNDAIIQTRTYKEGIFLKEIFIAGEGGGELYIPLISISDAKIIFKDFINNPGFCFKDCQINNDTYGILISWSCYP